MSDAKKDDDRPTVKGPHMGEAKNVATGETEEMPLDANDSPLVDDNPAFHGGDQAAQVEPAELPEHTAYMDETPAGGAV